jgi:hypothetical protein
MTACQKIMPTVFTSYNLQHTKVNYKIYSHYIAVQIVLLNVLCISQYLYQH